ncbi:hypothetical protein [Rickettsia endosymbiont of Oedothorax gibbosus]|uniref:hypothetical protein n=1 Tax=Rickettsia endosymbiont of Oedothorax gibbosus TaxID=931099 RepID=UPI002023F355|nr:hypothetical protein [Rickettsia endosymbiont of Oedothorax gibbosus]
MDRFEKLLVITAIASALIVKNGIIQNALNPIRIKRYKTSLSYSLCKLQRKQ